MFSDHAQYYIVAMVGDDQRILRLVPLVNLLPLMLLVEILPLWVVIPRLRAHLLLNIVFYMSRYYDYCTGLVLYIQRSIPMSEIGWHFIALGMNWLSVKFF